LDPPAAGFKWQPDIHADPAELKLEMIANARRQGRRRRLPIRAPPALPVKAGDMREREPDGASAASVRSSWIVNFVRAP
jgi:hypothetical protein